MRLLFRSGSTVFVHCVVVFVLVATAVFVLGPLSGSVDDDHDGMPDLPVVVAYNHRAVTADSHIRPPVRSAPISDQNSLVARANTRSTDEEHAWSAEPAREVLSSPLRC